MKDMTTDEMIAYLEKAMEEKHHPDWLGWVGQNKIFKYKTIPINSLAPADGWEGDQNKIDNMVKSDLSNAPLIVVHKDGTMIDGNHRHQALKKQGAQTVKAYVGESKMDLKLVNQEISEARLYRTTRNFGNLTGQDVASLFYLTSLSTYMMLKDDKQHEYATQYIKQTVQYGPYTLFRSHATDLYLLGHVIKDPDTRNITLKNPVSSKQYLNKLPFDNRKHYMFFMKLKTSGKVAGPEFNSYFMRLESQLKIKDQKYKQWRRLVADWENLKYTSKQLVTSRLLQEYRRLGKGSEMVGPLTTMTKYRSYSISDKYEQPKTSIAKRTAGTVAGAAAGRYVGKKVAKKLGKDIDKYKKYGTGLGAIAGYWASGRIKK
jgi:hypothetical protein